MICYPGLLVLRYIKCHFKVENKRVVGGGAVSFKVTGRTHGGDVGVLLLLILLFFLPAALHLFIVPVSSCSWVQM